MFFNVSSPFFAPHSIAIPFSNFIQNSSITTSWYDKGFDEYTIPFALKQSGDVNISSVGKLTNISFPVTNVSPPDAHK